MAGSGLRFGGTFKPFLRIGEETFIEAATRPFRDNKQALTELVFVIRREHEREFGASRQLLKMFADTAHRVVILNDQTAGPLATVRSALANDEVGGPIIACDCDHSLDVSGILAVAADPRGVDAAVPVWPISREEAPSWATALVGRDGRIKVIREKQWPSGTGAVKGVIGCYVIRQPEIIRDSTEAEFSSLLGRLIDTGGQVEALLPDWAEFFGDPIRLEGALRNRLRGQGGLYIDGHGR